MKTLRFTSADQRQKQFAATVRKRVNEYFREKGISSKGNAAASVKSIAMILLYLLPFAALLTVQPDAPSALLLVVLMGLGEAGVGMCVMHDAAHGAFSNKKWVNTALSWTMFLLGSNTFNWKVQHNVLHHTFTNIDGYDQDIGTKAMIRLSEHAPLRRFHRYQFLYAFLFYGLMTLSKLVTDIAQLLDFNRTGITREQGRNPSTEMLKLVLTKALYFTIVIGLPLYLTNYTWWQVLPGFAILHLVAGIIMSTVFQMAHVVEGAQQPLPDANGVIHNDWMVHELLTTADFARDNVLLGWYVGGLNFQIEHHLFPGVCHIHYRKIAPIVENTAKEYGLTYNLKPDLLSAFVSHAKRLKELGKPVSVPGDVEDKAPRGADSAVAVPGNP